MSKSSNLRRYLTKEDVLQEEILRVILRKYPQVKAIHVPNEGKRSDFEQLKFKVLGGEAGVADLFLVMKKASPTYKGLWIEVKYGRNKLSEDQAEFLQLMHLAGFETAIVYDKAEDFELMMDRYLHEPEYFKLGICLAKDAAISFLQAETVKARYVVKKSTRSQKRDLKAAFEKKAKARFGQPIKGRKLPNAGKLFNHTRNKHS